MVGFYLTMVESIDGMDVFSGKARVQSLQYDVNGS